MIQFKSRQGIWLRRGLLVRRIFILITQILLYAGFFFGAFLLRFDFSLPER